MSFGLAIQKAVFDKLSAATALTAITSISDDVGEFETYPYVTIGEDVLSEWDTCTTQGADGTITIHVWSRHKGRKQVKQIFSEIYTALHRQSLTVSGHDIISTMWVNETSFLDSDGLTRHGVQTYRLLVDKT